MKILSGEYQNLLNSNLNLQEKGFKLHKSWHCIVYIVNVLSPVPDDEWLTSVEILKLNKKFKLLIIKSLYGER